VWNNNKKFGGYMNTSQKSNELNKKSNLPIIFFLSLSLITALINSSVPTPLYPYYKEIFKLSATMVSVVYGGIMRTSRFNKRSLDLSN
jgi:hypothetical protein